MKSCELAVAYRMYPGISRDAVRVFGDKLATAEACLQSFRASLGSLRAHVWMILDNCPPAYEAMVRRCFAPDDVDVVQCNGIGNAATFALQREILSKQTLSDFVYFAEDDYLYRPGQMQAVVKFLASSPDVHFVTPYDHPDAYALPVSMSKAIVRIFGGLHWRTVSSTCLTFATRRNTLRLTEKAFSTFSRRNYDSSIWHALTKIGIREWLRYPVRTNQDLPSVKIILKTFLFGWRYIFFGRKYTLWSPIPSIATHLQQDGLAPNVDWLSVTIPGRVGESA